MASSLLSNKDSGEWDNSTDSTFLGLTDTQTNFAPSAQIFRKIAFLDNFCGEGPNFVIFGK